MVHHGWEDYGYYLNTRKMSDLMWAVFISFVELIVLILMQPKEVKEQIVTAWRLKPGIVNVLFLLLYASCVGVWMIVIKIIKYGL